MVKRITDKAINMKRSWKEASAVQERSGWGVESEADELQLMKVSILRGLEEIWGSRLNMTLIGV